jgi:hypothetical protein
MQNAVDSLFSAIKSLEELAYPDSKILPGVRRFVQFDSYRCGLRSVQSVLAYYGIQQTPRTLERKLRTTREGTDTSDILRVLRSYGLNGRMHREMGLRDIRKAIDNECPIIVILYEGWHYAVVYPLVPPLTQYIKLTNLYLDHVSGGRLSPSRGFPSFFIALQHFHTPFLRLTL